MITGPNGAGKTTLAEAVEKKVLERGMHIEVLDDRESQAFMSPDLGFGPDDSDLHLKRLAYASMLLNRNGVCSVVTAAYPGKRSREDMRGAIPLLLEIYVDCPPDVRRKRIQSVKGSQAERDEVDHCADLDASYDPPESPEVTVYSGKMTPEEGAAMIIRRLDSLHLLAPVADGDVSREEAELVKRRLTDLGRL